MPTSTPSENPVTPDHGRGVFTTDNGQLTAFPDNRRFVRIARGSLAEVQHWLRRAYNRNLLSHEDVQRVKSTVDELGPKLNAYLKPIGKARYNGPLTTDN